MQKSSKLPHYHTFAIVVTINKKHEIGTADTIVTDDKIMAFMIGTIISPTPDKFKNVIILGHNACRLLSSNKYKNLIKDSIVVCITKTKAASTKINPGTLQNKPECYFCPSFNKAYKLANDYCAEIHNLHNISPKIFVGGGSQLYHLTIEHPLCSEVIISIKLDSPEFKDATVKHFPRVDLSSSTIHGKPTHVTPIGSECISYVYEITNTHLHDYCQLIIKLINAASYALTTDKINNKAPNTKEFNQVLRFQLCDNSSRMILPVSTIHDSLEPLVYTLYHNLMHIMSTGKEVTEELGLKVQIAHHLHKYLRDLNGFDRLQHVIDLFRTRVTDTATILLKGSPTDLIDYRYPVLVLTVVRDRHENPAYLNMNVTGRSVEMFHEFNESLIMFSLLAHIIAKLCNLRAHELVFNIVEAHLALDDIPEAKKILSKTCYGYPHITFHSELDEVMSSGSLNDVTADYFDNKKTNIKLLNFYC